MSLNPLDLQSLDEEATMSVLDIVVEHSPRSALEGIDFRLLEKYPAFVAMIIRMQYLRPESGYAEEQLQVLSEGAFMALLTVTGIAEAMELERGLPPET